MHHINRCSSNEVRKFIKKPRRRKILGALRSCSTEAGHRHNARAIYAKIVI